MRPFRHRGVGEIWMRSLNRPAFEKARAAAGPAEVARCRASTSRRKTRRQPSHGRSLSTPCGTHPGRAGEEWFRPDPCASKTAAVPLIPSRIMSPSPRPDAAVTVPAITVPIRPPWHARALISADLVNGAAPGREWSMGTRRLHAERIAARSPDGHGHIVACGISPVRLHDNMICGG